MPKTAQNVSTRRRAFDFTNIFLFACLLLCLALLVREKKTELALAKDARLLKEQLAGSKTVQIGQILPPIELVSLAGSETTITDAENQPHVLFVFSIHCAVSRSTLPAWRDMAVLLAQKKWKFYAISLDRADELMELNSKYHLPFEIYLPRAHNFVQQNKLNALPQTIVLSQGNKVEWVRLGTLTRRDQQYIYKVLGDDLGH